MKSVLRWLSAGVVAAAMVLGVSGAAMAQDKAPVQMALVGAAHIHTPGFVNTLKGRSAGFQVKYVWDHDAARAKKSADQLGAKVVSDVNAIWADGDIKGVVICTETNRHLDLVLAAAKAKKHMFVEKPLGIGAKDAYTMAKAIEEAGVLFQTGYFMRGDAAHLFLREQVKQGNFGTITRIRGSNCHSGALGGWFDKEWRWMADPTIAGIGGFGDLGTHSLDIMMWMMGDVANVTATVSNGTARYPNCDEYGEGVIVFGNGTIGTLAAGWDDVANPVSLEICGTAGHATIVNGQLFFQSSKVKGADGKTAWKELPAGWPHAFDLFLDALGGKSGVTLVTAREAAARSAVMEALYQGARQKTWVTPEAGK